jgi:hypothetical protein
MRRLATIRTIADIRPIEGADRIVVAQVDGWECVVKKDEFTVGDSVVYIEIDSIVPERPEFEFLRERKFRVRTIRLRQQISQGLVMPMDILPAGYYRVGDDVTEMLGIKKHDPEAEHELQVSQRVHEKRNPVFMWFMRFKWFRRIFAKPKRKGGFPDWIVKTDEERIQNKTAMFNIEKNAGTTFTATEKLDGQSVTFFLQKNGRKKYEVGVCSRNIRRNKPNDSSYWTIARDLEIEKVLRACLASRFWRVFEGFFRYARKEIRACPKGTEGFS